MADTAAGYLDGNFHYVHDSLNAKLPRISFKIPQATYLAWVDMNPYLGDVSDLPDFFANQAGCIFPGKPLVEATGSLYNF